ncbi:MAG: formylglycine-generating enzyme family protein [Gammaproteobacteria bacterium]|nr:formylglycine-generating enzyme family protein [Gammaproteobacteria bacterium]
MRTAPYIILLLLLPGLLFAADIPTVTSLEMEQKLDELHLNYTLESPTGAYAEVLLEISEDQGGNWRTPKGAKGDIGSGIPAGANRIIWDIYSEYPKGIQGVVDFKLQTRAEQQQTPEQKAGDSWTDPYSGIEFVWIPAGEFMMGSPSSEPGRDDDERQHRVKLSEGYWLGRYEVTQRQWKKVMGNNPSKFTSCGSDCPVEKISWEDTQDFIRKLNGRGNGSFKLPSEAQWEYAARAGTTTPFSFGNNITTSQANYDGNYPYNGNAKGRYRKTTVTVGSFPANRWGLHEMHGNVWEWLNDWKGNYPSGTVTDPEGPGSGQSRVLRGGGWNGYAKFLRSASRDYISPSGRDSLLGVRLMRQP